MFFAEIVLEPACSCLDTHVCVSFVVVVYVCWKGYIFFSARLMAAYSCECTSLLLNYVYRLRICMLCFAYMLIRPRGPCFLSRYNLSINECRCNARLFVSVILVNMSSAWISVVVHCITPNEYVRIGIAHVFIHLIIFLAFSCVAMILVNLISFLAYCV